MTKTIVYKGIHLTVFEALCTDGTCCHGYHLPGVYGPAYPRTYAEALSRAKYVLNHPYTKNHMLSL